MTLVIDQFQIFASVVTGQKSIFNMNGHSIEGVVTKKIFVINSEISDMM